MHFLIQQRTLNQKATCASYFTDILPFDIGVGSIGSMVVSDQVQIMHRIIYLFVFPSISTLQRREVQARLRIRRVNSRHFVRIPSQGCQEFVVLFLFLNV